MKERGDLKGGVFELMFLMRDLALEQEVLFLESGDLLRGLSLGVLCLETITDALQL